MTDHPAKPLAEHWAGREHTPEVPLEIDTPVVVGGVRYRVTYDPQADATVLMTEADWLERLTCAKAASGFDLPTIDIGKTGPFRLLDGSRAFVVAFNLVNDTYEVRQVSGPGMDRRPGLKLNTRWIA